MTLMKSKTTRRPAPRSSSSCRRRLYPMSRPALSPFRHPPRLSLVQRRDLHDVAFEPGLDRPALQRAVDILGSPVIAVDGQQLGLGLAAEDACARTAVGAGHGS